VVVHEEIRAIIDAHIITAGMIYLVCLRPLVRLLSRFEHRQTALH
jgi:hypothetical protein